MLQNAIETLSSTPTKKFNGVVQPGPERTYATVVPQITA
jgi:hypothetical protein